MSKWFEAYDGIYYDSERFERLEIKEEIQPAVVGSEKKPDKKYFIEMILKEPANLKPEERWVGSQVFDSKEDAKAWIKRNFLSD